MGATHKLTVYRRYFTSSDCYKSATVQKTRGVQVHSTGANNPWLRRYVAPDDGRLGANRYGNHHNKPGSNVCASAYIGKMADGTAAVYQALPWEYRCWLSGSGKKGNANRLGYIGYEICEDGLDDKLYFDAVMDIAARLTAHLCDIIGAMPDDDAPCGKVVMDHRELHAAGYASNHGDIRHWASRHGFTMDDFRKLVRLYRTEGIDVEYVDATGDADRRTLRKGDRGDDVKTLQQMLYDRGYLLEVDGIFGSATQNAVRNYQQIHGLDADGVCGAKTWAALEAAEEATPDDAADNAQTSETDVDKPVDESPPNVDNALNGGDDYMLKTISAGSRGKSVKVLQWLLRDAGYQTGSVDGIFGSKTQGALTAYQRARGLTADGVAGNATWKALIG